ncbi:peroxiredoxin family protein [Exiguobacterium artemiae]|uniref:peroxiredoxin family protein n=1 Tax=Exiguobacterium artemiae TaxID=340145 RepID=UPI002964D661|nr:redoxin domain-containing protein [Exiguobacterium sibiricum]MDW2884672.1 redoxin domain-containing protein [Exiguobacterium sibiricum]
MPRHKKIAAVLILLLALGLIGINLYDNQQAKKQAAQEKQRTTILEKTQVDKTEEKKERATDFSLQTTDGKTIRLSDYRGKKVILNFWATWCPPCKAEMPHMQKFYEAHHDEVEVIAVNLTSLDNGNAALEKFIQDYKLSFTIPLDRDGEVGNQYKAYTIPTSYLIDADGFIEQKIIGPMNEEMMEELITSHG